jgi:uncharacterized protein YndB with AHSA1/START domain
VEHAFKTFEASRMVESSLDAVWQAWTTRQGLTSFFGPDARVELRNGGAYELRCAEDPSDPFKEVGPKHLLAYLPSRFITLDWRGSAAGTGFVDQQTWVVVEFEELGEELCEVTLSHLGFGEGTEWDEYLRWQGKFWHRVLNRMERSLCLGAADWDCPQQ